VCKFLVKFEESSLGYNLVFLVRSEGSIPPLGISFQVCRNIPLQNFFFRSAEILLPLQKFLFWPAEASPPFRNSFSGLVDRLSLSSTLCGPSNGSNDREGKLGTAAS
jgi:hypothetical protein